MSKLDFLKEITALPMGVYLQLVTKLTLLDETIIRSNDPEEVLTFRYQKLGNRFVIPWRKIKGKLRRVTLEKQRSLDISPNCHLKDDLCMKCPSCFIFGGTGETSSAKVSYNILGRILGETFISKIEVGEVAPYTQNAVDELTHTTGQALMQIVTVPRETEFYGVVTVKDPTKEMAAVVIDNLERLTRIGARSVEWGRAVVELIGYKLGDREDMSAYLLLSDENEEKAISDLDKIDSLSLPDVDSSYQTLGKQVTDVIGKIAAKK
jgi:CRISPR type I-D-associated protein Csc2